MTCEFFASQTDSLAWRNYEWKRKQDHHIRGNKEAVWWSHKENEKGWVSGRTGFNFCWDFSDHLMFPSNVGGQLWASMEIKASRKETGFSMVTLTCIYHRLFWASHGIHFFCYFRVQIWQSPDSHCHRRCFQRSRSVSFLHYSLLYLKKKVYLLSLTLLLLSEFLPWPGGAVCVAGPWHDKPRFSRGGRRILGGVLTGEAWVSQSCRYTEVTRPECSRNALACSKIGMGGTRWGLGSVPSSCSSVLWKWTAFCTQAV